ncbi:TetR/AcrR family transcriptional regulator [Desulfobacterales bacterium HSG16]|nr:TetR/AcrR family transcriptional regulator [Desulfobacterales bacterium HSG16]
MATRIKLLKAARECLLEKGSHAASIKTIAKMANVNHGLVHHYFGSKQGLFVELLRLHFDTLLLDQPKDFESDKELNAYVLKKMVPNARLFVEFRALSYQMPDLAKELAGNLRKLTMMIGALMGIDDGATRSLVTAAIFGLAMHSSIDPLMPVSDSLVELHRIFKHRNLVE